MNLLKTRLESSRKRYVETGTGMRRVIWEKWNQRDLSLSTGVDSRWIFKKDPLFDVVSITDAENKCWRVPGNYKQQIKSYRNYNKKVSKTDLQN